MPYGKLKFCSGIQIFCQTSKFSSLIVKNKIKYFLLLDSNSFRRSKHFFLNLIIRINFNIKIFEIIYFVFSAIIIILVL